MAGGLKIAEETCRTTAHPKFEKERRFPNPNPLIVIYEFY
jgi:hypothetical protein